MEPDFMTIRSRFVVAAILLVFAVLHVAGMQQIEAAWTGRVHPHPAPTGD
jgi:hypothetical protein